MSKIISVLCLSLILFSCSKQNGTQPAVEKESVIASYQIDVGSDFNGNEIIEKDPMTIVKKDSPTDESKSIRLDVTVYNKSGTTIYVDFDKVLESLPGSSFISRPTPLSSITRTDITGSFGKIVNGGSLVMSVKSPVTSSDVVGKNYRIIRDFMFYVTSAKQKSAVFGMYSLAFGVEMAYVPSSIDLSFSSLSKLRFYTDDNPNSTNNLEVQTKDVRIVNGTGSTIPAVLKKPSYLDVVGSCISTMEQDGLSFSVSVPSAGCVLSFTYRYSPLATAQDVVEVPSKIEIVDNAAQKIDVSATSQQTIKVVEIENPIEVTSSSIVLSTTESTKIVSKSFRIINKSSLKDYKFTIPTIPSYLTYSAPGCASGILTMGSFCTIKLSYSYEGSSIIAPETKLSHNFDLNFSIAELNKDVKVSVLAESVKPLPPEPQLTYSLSPSGVTEFVLPKNKTARTKSVSLYMINGNSVDVSVNVNKILSQNISYTLSSSACSESGDVVTVLKGKTCGIVLKYTVPFPDPSADLIDTASIKITQSGTERFNTSLKFTFSVGTAPVMCSMANFGNVVITNVTEIDTTKIVPNCEVKSCSVGFEVSSDKKSCISVAKSACDGQPHGSTKTLTCPADKEPKEGVNTSSTCNDGTWTPAALTDDQCQTVAVPTFSIKYQNPLNGEQFFDTLPVVLETYYEMSAFFKITNTGTIPAKPNFADPTMSSPLYPSEPYIVGRSFLLISPNGRFQGEVSYSYCDKILNPSESCFITVGITPKDPIIVERLKDGVEFATFSFGLVGDVRNLTFKFKQKDQLFVTKDVNFNVNSLFYTVTNLPAGQLNFQQKYPVPMIDDVISAKVGEKVTQTYYYYNIINREINLTGKNLYLDNDNGIQAGFYSPGYSVNSTIGTNNEVKITTTCGIVGIGEKCSYTVEFSPVAETLSDSYMIIRLPFGVNNDLKINFKKEAPIACSLENAETSGGVSMGSGGSAVTGVSGNIPNCEVTTCAGSIFIPSSDKKSCVEMPDCVYDSNNIGQCKFAP